MKYLYFNFFKHKSFVVNIFFVTTNGYYTEGTTNSVTQCVYFRGLVFFCVFLWILLFLVKFRYFLKLESSRKSRNLRNRDLPAP